MMDLADIVSQLRARIHEEEKQELMREYVLVPKARARMFVTLYDGKASSFNYNLKKLVLTFKESLNVMGV